ncbi:hypothetical protein Q1695_007907 [Nippostrongylus brasiliensis]|nr:hypothetical protein Q1695_007907 [Nippostrongylus brasiliensis]
MENVVPSHTIRRATMADQEALISIMAEAYTVSEPMAQALNVSKDDAEEFCRGFLPHYLSQGHSIVMESEGQIVGGYLLQLIERPNSAYESGPDPDLPPSVYTIECIAHKLTDNVSPFECAVTTPATYGCLEVKPGALDQRASVFPSLNGYV